MGRYTLGSILGAERVVASSVGANRASDGTASRGRGYLALVAGAVLGVLLIGLALWRGGPLLDQTSEEALLRRAQLYWDLRLAGDTAGAYDLMSAAYRRRVTPAQFAREGGALIRTGAQVKSVTIDEKGALVDVELKSRMADPRFAEIENVGVARERWVIEDGAWYRWPPGL